MQSPERSENSAFVNTLLKKAKEKNPTKPVMIHENVDMKTVEDFVKNIGNKNKRK